MGVRIPAGFALAAALAAGAWGSQGSGGVRQPESGAAGLRLAEVADYHLAEGRYGAAVVAAGNYLYVIGGSNDWGTRLDDVVRVNLATGKSEAFVTLKTARRYHRAILDGRKIFVLGGYSALLPGARNSFEESVEIIDLDSRKIALGAPMPIPKASFGCARVGDRIYVVGGEKLRGQSVTSTNSTEIYDLATDKWVAGAPMPVACQCVATVVEGMIVVAGGCNGLAALDNVEVYDPQRNGWAVLPRLCRAVSAHSLVSLDHYLLLFGDDDALNRVVAYDLNDRSSAAYSLKVDIGRHTAAVVDRGRVYVVGGALRSDRSALDDVRAFALAPGAP